jgi:hypothetical protein
MLESLAQYPRVHARKRGEYAELRRVGPDGQEHWWRVDDPPRGRPACAILPSDQDAYFAGYEHAREAAVASMRETLPEPRPLR